MYYENFEKLLKIKNVKPADVSKATGIATSTLTAWKKGGYTPKPPKLQQIADFFDVSLDYLTTGKEKDNSFTVENAHLLAQIIKDTELTKALNVYFGLSDAEKSHVINTINLMKK